MYTGTQMDLVQGKRVKKGQKEPSRPVQTGLEPPSQCLTSAGENMSQEGIPWGGHEPSQAGAGRRELYQYTGTNQSVGIKYALSTETLASRATISKCLLSLPIFAGAPFQQQKSASKYAHIGNQ